MGKWALCPPLRFQVEPPRPLRWRFLGLLALRLELLPSSSRGRLAGAPRTLGNSARWRGVAPRAARVPVLAVAGAPVRPLVAVGAPVPLPKPALVRLAAPARPGTRPGLAGNRPALPPSARPVLLVPGAGGGGECVEVLREIERRQFPLALPQLVFGLPPLQQGLPLFRFQLPDSPPPRCCSGARSMPWSAKLRWSTRAAWPCCWRWAFCASAHRCRVSKSRSSVPALSFRHPPSSGCFPLLALEVLLGIAVDAVNRPLRVHEVGVRLFAPCQRRAGVVNRPLVGVPLA